MASSLLIGVNLAGAEFAPSKIPGTYNTDYTYPTHAEIDYYASKGMEVIRLPFLWERLQRSEFGALDPSELSRLDDVVNYATSKGLKVDLDPHNYGYGFGNLFSLVLRYIFIIKDIGVFVVVRQGIKFEQFFFVYDVLNDTTMTSKKTPVD